jgi:hypothetical protein
MPKIFGNSSVKNNKSCRIFHNEHNKIWFTFFWIFCDLIWILQKSALHIYYLRTKLRSSPWKIFGFTSIPLIHRWAPGNNWGHAIGSPGAAGGGLAKIPAGSPVLAAEKGWGNARVVPRARFASELEDEAAPTRGLDGARRCTALRACLRRGRRLAGATRGGVSP